MLNETILLEQNRRLREENDELRETIRQLRETSLAPLPQDVPYLSVREETVFRALLASPGVVTREALYTRIYGHDSEVQAHIIDVFISHLRRRLVGTRYAVETVRARGWHLAIIIDEAIAA